MELTKLRIDFDRILGYTNADLNNRLWSWVKKHSAKIAKLEAQTDKGGQAENMVRRGEQKSEPLLTAGQELLCAMMDRCDEFSKDGMPVIKMVDKKNGGSVTYLRYDAVVKYCNTNFIRK